MALDPGGWEASRVEGRRDLPGHSAGLADSETKQTYLVSEATCQQMLYVKQSLLKQSKQERKR